MAANKFATMLHRNTPRITVVLVYAFLEWILIILLLLNSCFSFIISKFASYFGLPPPCLWCSPAISSASSPISHTDLICESHAKEISTLTFCNSHHRLADSQSMCHHCLASAPPRSASPAAPTIAAAFSFISWVAANGDHDETKKKADNCHHQCSCCGEIVAPDLYPPLPYLLLNPLKCGIQDAADDMKGIHLMLMGMEANDDDDDGDRGDGEAGANADCFNSLEDGTVEVLKETRNREQQGETERQRSCIEMEFVKQNQPSSDDHDRFIEYCFGEDDPLDIMSLHHVHHDSGSGFDSSTSSAYQVGSCKSPGLKQEIQGDEALVDAEEEHREKIHGEEEEEAARSIEIYASTENNGERSLAVNLAEPTTTGLDEDANTQGWEIYNSEAEQGPLLNCGDQQHKAEIEDMEPVGKQEEYSIVQEGIAEDTAVILNDELEKLHTPSSNEVQEESTPLPSQIEEEESEPATAPEQSHVTSNGLGELLQFNTSVEKNDAPQQSHVNSNGLGELLHCNTSIEKNDAPQQSHVTSNGLGELLHFNTSIEKNDAPQQSHVISNGLSELLHFNTSVEKSGEGIGNPDQEKLPDTPNFMDNIQNNLHNKLLMMFEKRDSGAEESFDDGSVVSEIENGDPVLTIERLRTALKSEQNALNALYTELEEERSASAIAANQTMAMINRLQEEKAAMQMEALQYQRMMEEQSEYDQEALQLLNDLMIKREKEKQELERELEVYRKRVLDYEAREKLRMVRRRRSEDGSLRSVKSSSTCNNGEDSEELSSIDLNREARDESGSMSENPESSNDHNSYGGGEDENINLEEIAMDCVHHMTALDDSLAEFEDERVSILDQLKVLEEKLLNLGDSNELMNDVNSVRQSLNYCSVSQHGFDDSYDNKLSTPEEEDGAKEIKHCPERKTMASMAKSLLPLLDAAEEDDDDREEEEEGQTNEKKNVEISGMDGDSSSVVSRFGGESKTLAIEDEVDHVYERLQALEADREFLKHCMSSIQKGDKGMDLLQEILQHLRDLRAVEFRVRSMSESPLS